MKASIKSLFENPSAAYDKSFQVAGWVKSLRKSKKFAFLVLNDGSCFQDLQIIVDADLPNYENATSVSTGYCVKVEGKVVQSGGRQALEMQASSVEIVGTVPEDYPLQKKSTSLEFLRENAHLRARTNTLSAVFRVRHQLCMATHDFFNKKGYYYIHTPIVTASDCEGAGELFRVSTLNAENPPRTDKGEVNFSEDYFGKQTFLCVSGQLEAESLALSLGGVYTFGPTFRSENSNTPRHLAEFWMVEPEVAFADLEDIAALGAEYIQYLISWALKHCPDEIAFFEKQYKEGLVETLNHVVSSEFKKITYTEAVEILQNSGEKFEFPVAWGSDLQTEHERFLTEKHFNSPVIVTDYPKEIKAFYMKQSDDGKTVRAMDILVPGVGEIIGGSQREDDLEKLKKRIQEMNLPEKEYWWYLDLRRFGSAPHSGFGLGLERAVMYITGMSNIRDVIPFPRFPKSVEF